MPPIILSTEPQGASSGVLRTEPEDLSSPFESEAEEALAQTRSYRVSRLLSALATEQPPEESRRQAVDGGIRIAGGPSHTTSRREIGAVYSSASLGTSIDSVGTIPPPYAQYSDGSVSGSARSRREDGSSRRIPSGDALD